MAHSHCEHGQGKTVLSCLVLSCPCRWCERNWRHVKTVSDWKFRNCFVQSRNVAWTKSCLVLTQFPWLPIVMSFGNWFTNAFTPQTRQNCSVSHILKTVCDCRELSSHRRQDKTKTVLSCPCSRCERATLGKKSPWRYYTFSTCSLGQKVIFHFSKINRPYC